MYTCRIHFRHLHTCGLFSVSYTVLFANQLPCLTVLIVPATVSRRVIYICMYMYVYILYILYVHVHTHVYVHAHVHVHVDVHVHIKSCICIHMSRDICIDVRVLRATTEPSRPLLRISKPCCDVISNFTRTCVQS